MLFSGPAVVMHRRCRLKVGLGLIGLLVVVTVSGDWYYVHSESKPPQRDPSDTFRTNAEQLVIKFDSETENRVRFRSLGESSRHLDQIPSEVLVPSDATLTLHNEIDAVLRRIDYCLVSTNMSAYFKRKGFYNRAQANARLVLKELRKIIPRFQTPYTIPCWNVSFYATWKSKYIKRRNSITYSVSGSIGRHKFSYETKSHSRNYVHKQIFDNVHWNRRGRDMYIRQSVACLPKLFLLGYPKCGSTFLYCLIHRTLKAALKITKVCEVVKEPHWWVVPGPRDNLQPHSPDYVPLYLMNFYQGADYTERGVPAVTIDGSPNLMFQWPRYSGDETVENYCLIPSLIPVVLPDSKYFVVMRNPVTMLYSAFWYSCTREGAKIKSVKYMGPDIFHERITTKITIFNECRAKGEPLDMCMNAVADDIYGSDLEACGRSRLEMGLYYVHTRKWLSVVPRERIHFFTLEELATQDVKRSARVILDFLEIPSADIDLPDTDCNENTQERIDYRHDPGLQMREDTRQILEEFFQPYNRMLADLLGDDKFLWNNR